MAQVVAYEDVKGNRKQRDIPGGHAWRTDFLLPPEGANREPSAFLAEGSPHRVIPSHYHDVDEFQVMVKGGGMLGKHDLAIHAVHFARAYTPYGPIIAGKEGLGFLTLRPSRSSPQSLVSECSEKLKSIPNRKPMQLTELPKFGGSGNVSVHAFSKFKDQGGVAAFSLSLRPNAETSAPDPATSNGQYLIITKGSLWYLGNEYKAITVAHVKPDEQPFRLVAGGEGLDALVLNFPREAAPRQATVARATKNAGSRVWQCQLCGFAYDEVKGLPDEGIPPGTRWEDVPETWTCQDCATSKNDFEMVVVS